MLTRFKQVDVFTSVPLKGNPLAVVFDADDLTDALRAENDPCEKCAQR